MRCSAVGDRFGKYRDPAAQVNKEVTFSRITDAASSTAMEAGMLPGYRLPGRADNHLRRRPWLVREPCDAIKATFAVDRHWAAAEIDAAK
ncbi:MAG TPA: hypothetical protein VGI81_08735 [Tepidisphaeraceae bacterium]